MTYKSAVPSIIISFVGVVFLISNHLANAQSVAEWEADFHHELHAIDLGEEVDLNLNLKNLNTSHLIELNAVIRVVSSHPEYLQVSKIIPLDEIENGEWSGSFKAVAITLGCSNISVEIIGSNNFREQSSAHLEITVYRDYSLIYNLIDAALLQNFDLIFKIVLFTLFGLALNLSKVKDAFRNPSALGIGFFWDLLLLPLVSCSFFQCS